MAGRRTGGPVLLAIAVWFIATFLSTVWDESVAKSAVLVVAWILALAWVATHVSRSILLSRFGSRTPVVQAVTFGVGSVLYRLFFYLFDVFGFGPTHDSVVAAAVLIVTGVPWAPSVKPVFAGTVLFFNVALPLIMIFVADWLERVRAARQAPEHTTSEW